MLLDSNTVDPTKFYVRDPRREDDVYVCRVQYDRSKKEKADFKIDAVRVVDIKESSIVYLSLPKDWLRVLLDVEEALLDYTKKNANGWFNDRLTPDIVEDYFTSSIVVHKKHGHVLKLSSKRAAAKLQAHTFCNVVLNLSALKFYKKKFNLLWSVEEVSALEQHPPAESDDEGSHLDEDLEFMGPDIPDIVTIHEGLVQRAQRFMSACETRMAQLSEKIDTLRKKHERVRSHLEALPGLVSGSGSSPSCPISFSRLDKLSDVLDEEEEERVE